MANEFPIESEPLYWLHIPLEAPRGHLLGRAYERGPNPPPEPVSVLGKCAQLHTRDPFPRSHAAVSPSAVHQWLVFDPMPRGEADALFKEFSKKLPVLSLRMSASFRIGPWADLRVAPADTYNGPMPTLIAAEHVPTPLWTEASIGNSKAGWEHWLDNCQSVNDPRLIAALELYVSANDDSLARSQFLTYLTILDSLAEQWPRDATAIEWIEERLNDGIVVADRGLGDALQNLKKVSHGKAVRELVGRAGMAKGLDPSRTKALIKKAGELYTVRSNLSHAGNTDTPDVQSARSLVELVLDQAVLQPSLLDVPKAAASVAAT